MDLLAKLPEFGMSLAWVIPSALLVLTVVVFVHEFGHYWVGRMCGIDAEVFSIGFGRPLWQRTDRRGTVWQIASLPLGGYVRFVGDMDPASAGRSDAADLTPEQQAVAFHNARLWRRALTVLAGPVANFILSIVVFAGLVLWSGLPSDRPEIAELGPDASPQIGFMPGDRVLAVDGQPVSSFSEMFNILAQSDEVTQSARIERDGTEQDISVRFLPQAVVTGLQPGMPAARAGIVPGDVILSVNGEPTPSARRLRVVTAELTPGAEITIEVDRQGETRSFSFVPEPIERIHPVTGKKALVPTMGISLPQYSVIAPPWEPVGPLIALEVGAANTWRIISGSMIMIRDMMFAGADKSQIGGPIRIFKMSGEVAKRGFSDLIHWIAVLSTAIGLINLFPVPILDGGHLLFYAFEALRGRPIGETAMRIGTMIGLSLVLLLLVFATYNDLMWLL